MDRASATPNEIGGSKPPMGAQAPLQPLPAGDGDELASSPASSAASVHTDSTDLHTCGDSASAATTEAHGTDAEFLRWVANWLDILDPILGALYSRPDVMPNPEDRRKVVAWLDGAEVQERLRQIAKAVDA